MIGSVRTWSTTGPDRATGQAAQRLPQLPDEDPSLLG